MNIISLGAGVQSSTMALMAAHGEITPMPDAAIFADTQAEPKAVYDWLDWLEKQLPFPVYRVTAGNLALESLKVRTSRNGNKYLRHSIPAFTLNARGQKGMLPRQCTRDFKVDPIRRQVSKLAGRAQVFMWIGISRDEVQRMKESPVKKIINRWPLVEIEVRRQDCIYWMVNHGYPKPPRSACIFCPYHNDTEWFNLSENERINAAEWEILYQKAVAEIPQISAVPYLHSERIPLSRVKFEASRQYEMFNNECEGMCGV